MFKLYHKINVVKLFFPLILIIHQSNNTLNYFFGKKFYKPLNYGKLLTIIV